MSNIRHRICFGFPTTIDIDGSEILPNYILQDQLGNDLEDQAGNPIEQQYE